MLLKFLERIYKVSLRKKNKHEWLCFLIIVSHFSDEILWH